MEKCIVGFFNQLKIGRKQSFKNLAMYPLLSNYHVSFDYNLLDEALGKSEIKIVEIDQEGSVPDLKVTNKSSTMILIIDGEELVGAKQNRIVNTTILIPADSTILIPVSCVEQGRWSYESSPSMAMSEIYEKEKPVLDEYINGFKNTESQVGAVFMINGKVAGMDCFGKSETFSSVFNKLISSYAIDAIDWFNKNKEFKVLKSKVTSFLKNASKATIETHKSVGKGIDCRFETKKITGFSLCHEDQIAHLAAFLKPETDKPNSRFQRFSHRRDHRI